MTGRFLRLFITEVGYDLSFSKSSPSGGRRLGGDSWLAKSRYRRGKVATSMA
jgi:hypothetical protein